MEAAVAVAVVLALVLLASALVLIARTEAGMAAMAARTGAAYLALQDGYCAITTVWDSPCLAVLRRVSRHSGWFALYLPRRKCLSLMCICTGLGRELPISGALIVGLTWGVALPTIAPANLAMSY